MQLKNTKIKFLVLLVIVRVNVRSLLFLDLSAQKTVFNNGIPQGAVDNLPMGPGVSPQSYDAL
jgi:hypothetical protein